MNRRKLPGVATASKRLSDGTRRKYYYAWRGGPMLKSENGAPLAPNDPQFAVAYAAAHAERKKPATGTLFLKAKLDLKELPETIVVDETTGRAYNEHTYRHLFAEIRSIAIKGVDVPRVPACPSLAFINERTNAPDFKHDQDLRNTCVMLLDRSGSDLLSICDVTGHSYQSAQLIMEHYRSRNADRADAAIDKLVSFIAKDGF